MLNDYLQIYKCSIVVVGSFNPAIIQPFWLAQKKLIREQEAQNAEIDMIHTGIARFKLEWCEFEILNDRFEIKSTQQHMFSAMRDLIISIFNILKETPVQAYGINHVLYYAFPDQKRYYDIGVRLGTLNNWDGILTDPRMFSVEIGEMKRNDGKDGSYRIRVQPSDIKLPLGFGIMVAINDHIQFKENKNGKEFASSITETFDSSGQRSKSLPEKLWQKLEI